MIQTEDKVLVFRGVPTAAIVSPEQLLGASVSLVRLRMGIASKMVDLQVVAAPIPVILREDKKSVILRAKDHALLLFPERL